jgi:Ca2+-dependent lipid-binding protein
VKETVEPLIDYYRPKGVTRLGFKKVSLGSVPPKVVGIRTLDTNESCAILDLEVRERRYCLLTLHILPFCSVLSL